MVTEERIARIQSRERSLISTDQKYLGESYKIFRWALHNELHSLPTCLLKFLYMAMSKGTC